MEKIGIALIVVLTLALGLILASGWADGRAAAYEYSRGQAQAAIITAQGQAALNRAEATQMAMAGATTMMLAAIPWGVLFVLAVFGLAIIALAGLMVLRRPVVVQPPPQIVERQIIYLPPPGQSRREVWQALSTRSELTIFRQKR